MYIILKKLVIFRVSLRVLQRHLPLAEILLRTPCSVVPSSFPASRCPAETPSVTSIWPSTDPLIQTSFPDDSNSAFFFGIMEMPTLVYEEKMTIKACTYFMPNPVWALNIFQFISYSQPSFESFSQSHRKKINYSCEHSVSSGGEIWIPAVELQKLPA